MAKLTEWFYMTVCAYPRTWILSSFAGGFAAGYLWRDLHQFLKTFTIPFMVALLLIGGGNQWAM